MTFAYKLDPKRLLEPYWDMPGDHAHRSTYSVIRRGTAGSSLMYQLALSLDGIAELHVRTSA